MCWKLMSSTRVPSLVVCICWAALGREKITCSAFSSWLQLGQAGGYTRDPVRQCPDPACEQDSYFPSPTCCLLLPAPPNQLHHFIWFSKLLAWLPSAQLCCPVPVLHEVWRKWQGTNCCSALIQALRWQLFRCSKLPIRYIYSMARYCCICKAPGFCTIYKMFIRYWITGLLDFSISIWIMASHHDMSHKYRT